MVRLGSKELLLSLSAGLAGVGGLLIGTGPYLIPADPIRPALRDAEERVVISKTVLPVPDREAFSEIIERPLFSQSRRPPPEAGDQDPDNPALLNFHLVGVIVSTQSRVALIRPTTEGPLLRKTIGEDLDGWEISEINSSTVIIKRGTATETLRLVYNHPVKSDDQSTNQKEWSPPEAQNSSDE